MEIASLHSIFLKSGGVSTDTRTIKHNQLFFALSGENFDGNKYAKQAIEKGAVFAIVDDKKLQGDQYIYFENALPALQDLAKYHRKYLSIPILALTGSNGKTTTKELINAVLSKKFNTTATIGNLNNHIGVPLTLLSMTENTEFGIVEMGANHMKEIALLSSIAQPNYGLITNVGKAHLEGFGSEENILIGKTELYDFLKQDLNSIVFVNSKDDRLISRSSGLQSIYFGLNNNEKNLKTIELIEENPSIKLKWNGIILQSYLMGAYNAENIAAAITIGEYFNVNSSDIKEAIEEYLPSNNRSQIVKTNANVITLDAYNANPTSMLLSIKNFEKAPKTNSKTVILGDMFELGKTSIYEHTSIINYLKASEEIDRIILVGSYFKESAKNSNLETFEKTEEVINFIKEHPIKEQQLLIKGSRGMKLESLMDFL